LLGVKEKMYQITFQTNSLTQFLDITSQVQEVVTKHPHEASLCTIFVPHTTAGITINENADPDVQRDMLLGLERIVPIYKDFKHCEGNSDAHLKASLMGSSVQIIIANRKLMLGTWQAIYLAEFDGPRRRNVWVNLL